MRGKVQGVGFRPFVWQLAQALQLTGDVCNDGEGVLVRLAGNGAFHREAAPDCPPLARIEYRHAAVPLVNAAGDIHHSPQRGAGNGHQIVRMPPPVRVRLREMNDPHERRYRYPFINCTHCGPRFTIIRAMPYDRPATAMAPFPLCSPCETEYRNPLRTDVSRPAGGVPDCGPLSLSGVRPIGLSPRRLALNAAVQMLKTVASWLSKAGRISSGLRRA